MGHPTGQLKNYTTPQAKEDIAPQAPPPLLPGVGYSSSPIIAAFYICINFCLISSQISSKD